MLCNFPPPPPRFHELDFFGWCSRDDFSIETKGKIKHFSAMINYIRMREKFFNSMLHSHSRPNTHLIEFVIQMNISHIENRSHFNKTSLNVEFLFSYEKKIIFKEMFDFKTIDNADQLSKYY